MCLTCEKYHFDIFFCWKIHNMWTKHFGWIILWKIHEWELDLWKRVKNTTWKINCTAGWDMDKASLLQPWYPAPTQLSFKHVREKYTYKENIFEEKILLKDKLHCRMIRGQSQLVASLLLSFLPLPNKPNRT